MINSIQLFNPVAFNDNQKLKYFKDRENISYLDGAQVSIGTQLCGAIKTTPENSNRMITVDCGGKQGKSVSIMQTLEYAYDIPICGLVVNGKHVELEEKKVEPPVEEP